MAILALAGPLAAAAGSAGIISASTATVLGAALSGLSAIGQYTSAQAQAKAQAQAGIYQQKVAEQNAGQVEAQSQRNMLIAQRQGALVASSARAAGAAGGGSSSDPTMVNLIGDINTQGQLNALNELYSGTSRADAIRQGGNMAAYQGRIDAASTRSQATANLIGDSASLMAKYGGDGPPKIEQAYSIGRGGMYWPDGRNYFGSAYS